MRALPRLAEAGSVYAGGPRGTTPRNDQRELSAHCAAAEAAGQLGGRARADLLELFRQLPRHHQLSIAEHLLDRLQGSEQPVRRLVEYDRHVEAAEGLAPVQPPPGFGRQEPLE